MDIESRKHWVEYSRAKDEMFAHTDRKKTPWYVVDADNKKLARLNCISHLLTLIPWKQVKRKKINLPKRSNKGAYDDQKTLKGRRIVPEKY